MEVSLINIDSKIPNIALEKLKLYHLQKGDSVKLFDMKKVDLVPLMSDRVYVSCIYTKNSKYCDEWSRFDKVILGGSGWNLKSRLPDEVEKIKLRINLGFTTRGCPRKCGFCVVPEKEGNIRVVGDLYDVWDGISKKVVLLDNNILAVPEHFKMICEQAIKNKVLIDFNQGLDHRLLTNEICWYLMRLRHKGYRFSFDDPSYLKSVKKTIKLLKSYKINYNMWYVLVGYNTTLKEDFERISFLKSEGERPYVMRYKNEYKYIPMAMWANNRKLYKKTFREFLNYSERIKYKIYYEKNYPFAMNY